MRSRLITLMLLVGAGWALIEWARKEDMSLPPVAVGGVLYEGLEIDSITRFGFETRGGDWVEFERDPPGPWRITRPTDELAEQEYVEAALHALVNSRVLPLERQGIEVAPEALGLDPPKYRMLFEVGTQQGTLFLGNMDAFGKGLFARRGVDGEVVMITPNLITHLEHFRPEDYVDKSVFRGYEARVVGLRVESAEGVAVDANREGAGWRVNAPRAGRGDATRLNKVVRTLQFANQQQVGETNPSNDTLAAFGLPNALQRESGELAESTLVELRPENEDPVRVYLQANWREVSGGVIYAIREDGHKLLGIEQREFTAIWQADQREFLDPRFWPPLTERASSFSVLSEDELRLDLRRGARGDWVFRAPERLAGEPVDAVLVDARSGLTDLLGSVDELRAQGFTEAPAGEPVLVIAAGWEAAGSYQRERLEILSLEGELLPARFTARPGEGFLLGREVLEFLDPFLPDRLRGLRPIQIDSSAWVEQHLVLEGRSDPIVLRRQLSAEGLLSVVGDDDRGRALGLGLDLLERLQGLTWAPSPEASVAYPWSISWYDPAGELLGRLELRRVGPGEDAVVFGLPVVRARWSGVSDGELVLDESWLGRVLELSEDV